MLCARMHALIEYNLKKKAAIMSLILLINVPDVLRGMEHEKFVKK